MTDTPCEFCSYPFDQEAAGLYGCPNCHGEGLEERPKRRKRPPPAPIPCQFCPSPDTDRVKGDVRICPRCARVFQAATSRANPGAPPMPHRDPVAEIEGQATLAALVTAEPAPDTQDTRTPDEIRAAARDEAHAVDSDPTQGLGVLPAIPEVDEPQGAFDRLEAMAETATGALHITPQEWDEIRADERALRNILVTSDGATFRGRAIAVEGGIELPAPEMPAPAIAAEEGAQEDAQAAPEFPDRAWRQDGE